MHDGAFLWQVTVGKRRKEDRGSDNERNLFLFLELLALRLPDNREELNHPDFFNHPSVLERREKGRLAEMNKQLKRSLGFRERVLQLNPTYFCHNPDIELRQIIHLVLLPRG